MDKVIVRYKENYVKIYLESMARFYDREFGNVFFGESLELVSRESVDPPHPFTWQTETTWEFRYGGKKYLFVETENDGSPSYSLDCYIHIMGKEPERIEAMEYLPWLDEKEVEFLDLAKVYAERTDLDVQPVYYD